MHICKSVLKYYNFIYYITLLVPEPFTLKGPPGEFVSLQVLRENRSTCVSINTVDSNNHNACVLDPHFISRVKVRKTVHVLCVRIMHYIANSRKMTTKKFVNCQGFGSRSRVSLLYLRVWISNGPAI